MLMGGVRALRRDHISVRRPTTYALVLVLLASLALTLATAPANAGLIATHRISPGATIGDSLQCRITIVSRFGGGSSTSIWYDTLEVRNYSGQLTVFSGEVREENGGKVWYLPRFSTGPNASIKIIPVKQLFRYSRDAGFRLTLNSSSFGCGGRSESVRFLSY
jgi:hypothetical protein